MGTSTTSLKYSGLQLPLLSIISMVLLAGCTSYNVSVSESIGHPGNAANNSCSAFENTQPICGFNRPEDLAVLPGNKAIVVSEFGDTSGAKPGELSLLDLANAQRIPLFRGGDGKSATAGWGDPACTQAPGKKFSPHGIDITRRDDGKLQLLVVQHGGRESIEFFELTGSEAQWNIAWRGCVIAPEDAQLNSVAADRHGKFYTTKMLSHSASLENLKAYPTGPTGLVYRWSVNKGYKEMPGTIGSMPNGIVTSEDGTTLYVNYSAEGEVRKIDTVTGEVLAKISVSSPDNIKWSADKQLLLVASLHASTDDAASFTKCMKMDSGFCPISFSIIALDPLTLYSSEFFYNPDAPMGGGTVGLKVEDQLFIGSFAGDRILRVDSR